MTEEQTAAYVIGIAAMVNARVAGMQAENTRCAINGQQPIFGLDAFEKVISETGCHHNGIISTFYPVGP